MNIKELRQKALDLIYYDEMSISEIASQLNVEIDLLENLLYTKQDNKYIKRVVEKNVPYYDVLERTKDHKCYASRIGWNSILFYNNSYEDCALRYNGIISKNLHIKDEVWDRFSGIWMIVEVTDEALEILKENKMLD
jgi:hypothetical protein